MSGCIGIRKEDKNRWERRAPLTPDHVRKLKEEHGVDVMVQSSKIRVFGDSEYTEAGAEVTTELSKCQTIFAIKEIPIDLLEKDKTYIFFAHVIKGQKHNMPMLKKMMELRCNLIDYERIMNEKGFRLIFFGRWAGIAGMTNTLAALGERLASEGIKNPFSQIRHAHEYRNAEELKKAVFAAGDRIRNERLPKSIVPVVVGLAGYGNVSKGCQEVLSSLPIREIPAEKLKEFMERKTFSDKLVYKVVFKEEHMVRPKSNDLRFELLDYYKHPEKYQGVFEGHVPHLTVLMNCIFWDKQYPRLVTKKLVKGMFEKGEPKLKIIGDISCDIGGAIEFTEKATDIECPTFVYDPIEDRITDGVSGRGIVVMAVDNLPCELPRESSEDFGRVLFDFVLEIASADFSSDFSDLKLPLSVKKALILHKGRLTPDYEHLTKFL